jgi:hypothetical protein
MHRWFRAIWRRIYGGRNRIVNVIGTLTIEAFAVALGVYVGLAAESRKEYRNERAEEREKLMEIRSNLVGDLADLRENYFTHEDAGTSTQILLRHLQADAPYHDSLQYHFGKMGGTQTFFNSRSGAYEALKNTGVELITNKSLRNNLVKLYDFNYEQIFRMDRLQDEKSDVSLRLFQQKFSLDTARGIRIPKDYQQLKSDGEYLDLLFERKADFETYRGVYYNYALQVDNLVDMINQELVGKDDAPDEIGVFFTLKGKEEAREVLLHGEFLPWDVRHVAMEYNEDLEAWTGLAFLFPDMQYLYHFEVDGVHMNDPDNTNYVFDGYAGYSSVIEVDDTYPYLIFEAGQSRPTEVTTRTED